VESVSPPSIGQLIEEQATRNPKGIAIAAPGRLPLTYFGLRRQVENVVGRLNRLGVGRGDRVAIVLHNGPEMATAFLGTAAAATAAPLNPAYTTSEFEFYLSDLSARAVIVGSGADSAVRAVARARGIALFELTALRSGEAGSFELTGTAGVPAEAGGAAEMGDVALILHTSGTTSRPKMIPLTHANLLASARNIRSTLQLAEDDRCLNVMPLFHIHGLVAGLLASLAAGGRVICSPGFSSVRFFTWMDECRPTWYTAVPAMHQEVVAHASQHAATIAECRLRFIRSSSAPLPPQVMLDLERVFDAPVIEAYGMTEASHQIASNPLPSRARKQGSVGLPAGPEVSILDEAGRPVPQGQSGEIAIRGANVTSIGRPPEADGSSGGVWFRTGDVGFFDADGYLFISGRVKEMINRGGEKISPREIDEILLEHPGVAQAVACAISDPRLGEDVVAVVVRRTGTMLSERELREFASTRLAPFKVPRRVLFVDEIPKGPTGKIQRIGLADRLGIKSLGFSQPTEAAGFVPPQTKGEMVIAEIWKKVLKLDRVSAADNFFELGGDSLASAEVVNLIEQQFGTAVEIRQLAFGTLRQVAAACEDAAQATARKPGGWIKGLFGRARRHSVAR
jgi:acyl-CoA synthetase (AMP-forming)/AMP-acid ligase II/acyl carrier protein